MTLFPGTGFVEERGGPHARGTAVNVPLLAGTGDASWLAGRRAASCRRSPMPFGPTLLVTQHGCDSHAFDPLAHLRLTTAAIPARHAAARRHRPSLHREGRWLATGGGGYDAYRVVPRSWALVWLAQAHRDPPEQTPEAWRDRWAASAEVHRQGPPPVLLLDLPGTVDAESEAVAASNRRHAEAALSGALRHLHGGFE